MYRDLKVPLMCGHALHFQTIKLEFSIVDFNFYSTTNIQELKMGGEVNLNIK